MTAELRTLVQCTVQRGDGLRAQFKLLTVDSTACRSSGCRGEKERVRIPEMRCERSKHCRELAAGVAAQEDW